MAKDNTALIIIIVAIGALYLFGQQGAAPATVPTSGGATTVIPATGGVTIVSEAVTVTFSSWDAYSSTTNAGSGHRALLLNGLKNIEINDDGTKSASAGDAYKVLLGNLTTDLADGDYYPTYLEGSIPSDKTTASISGGQYKTQYAPTFSYWNNVATASSATAIGAGETGDWEFRFKAGTDVCFGNKDAADQFNAKNILCLKYNNTLMKPPALKEKGSGIDVSTAKEPTQVSTTADWSSVCYSVPVICDGAEITYSVHTEPKTSSSNPSTGDNVTIVFSDVTYDYNAKTGELIVGVEDEDGNDIGLYDRNKNSTVVPRDNSFVLPTT